MEEKKYIDRLYQEKFRDFEATPKEEIWKSISAKLQEKERKRPMISPWWYRAAGVAAIFALAFLIGNSTFNPTSTPLAETDVNAAEENIQSQAPALPTFEIPIAAAISREEIPAAIDPKMAKTEEIIFSPASNIENVVHEDLVSSISSKGLKNRTVLSTEKVVFPEIRPQEILLKEKEAKKSIFDEIAIASEVVEIEKEQFQSKFEVSTHAAPIYYGNMGSGNFIDPIFTDNKSQGEITFSYGVNLTYSITEKFRLRSGINKVAMSYNTSGIAYHAVINPTAIGSITYKDTDIQVIDNTAPTRQDAMASATNRVSVGSLNPGSLNQQLGYLEVPVELEYSLLDKKFGINLIAGASTLFLDENMISITSGQVTTDLGEANNLNNLSFSTNVGIGLDYDLSKKIKLNLEPMFKYQINTFDAASSEYQPYYFGIYSGFSYKF